MILSDRKHLISTVSVGELHTFAECLGFKREWFQDHPKHPHYDLTTSRAADRARKFGAREVSSKELTRRAWED